MNVFREARPTRYISISRISTNYEHVSKQTNPARTHGSAIIVALLNSGCMQSWIGYREKYTVGTVQILDWKRKYDTHKTIKRHIDLADWLLTRVSSGRRRGRRRRCSSSVSKLIRLLICSARSLFIRRGAISLPASEQGNLLFDDVGRLRTAYFGRSPGDPRGVPKQRGGPAETKGETARSDAGI